MTIIGTIPPGKPGLKQIAGGAQIEVNVVTPTRPTTFTQHRKHLERRDQPECEAIQKTPEGLPFVYVDERGTFIVRASDKELFEQHGYRVCGSITRPDQLPCMRMSK